MPVFVSCLKPAEYQDTSLFVNREEDLSLISSVLGAYLNAQADADLRMLIQGPRGFGKSILTRRAIDRALQEYGPLYVEVDGASGASGPEALLRELASELAEQLQRHSSQPELRLKGEILHRISRMRSRTLKEIRSDISSVSAKLTLAGAFMETVQYEFGAGTSSQRAVTREDSFEQVVDADLLRRLLKALLRDAARAGQKTLIFLDNLDQIGYAERERDIAQVTDLTRELLTFRHCVLLINLRDEFVSFDIQRHWRTSHLVRGLTPAALCQILERRIETAPEVERAALGQSRVREVARILAGKTESPLAFLQWVDGLLTRTELDPDTLDQDLRQWAFTQFSGVLTVEELEIVGSAFSHKGPRFVTEQELLAQTGFSRGLVDLAAKVRAIVPDYVIDGSRYCLAPELSFLMKD